MSASIVTENERIVLDRPLYIKRIYFEYIELSKLIVYAGFVPSNTAGYIAPRFSNEYVFG